MRRAGHAVPVMDLTANDFSDDRARCLAAGMDDFIAKPENPPKLYAVLVKWLGLEARRAGAA